MTSPAFILVRRPSAQLDKGELTHIDRVEPDLALARRQHEEYRAAMASAGGTLIDVPAAEAFPDSTFVEDIVLAFPECFVLCRPGAASRLGETDLLEAHVPRDRLILRVEAPATVEGGDVLQIGREVFVGLSSRTNQAAVGALAALLAPFGYRVTGVPVTGSLHLKTAVTAPADDLLVANAEWVDLAPFGLRRVLNVDPSEPFAGNTLRVGDRLFAQTAHRRTTERLREAGIVVDTLDMSEFAKLEAGLTCLSVVIPQTA